MSQNDNNSVLNSQNIIPPLSIDDVHLITPYDDDFATIYDDENRFSSLYVCKCPSGQSIVLPIENYVGTNNVVKENVNIKLDSNALPEWKQTPMLSREELNQDYLLERERINKIKLEQGFFSSKNRKNKSKVMVFKPRPTNSKHLPYWDVNHFLKLGALEFVHPECILQRDHLLNCIAKFVSKEGKFPPLSWFRIMLKYVDSCCHDRSSMCQMVMLTSLFDVKFYELDDKQKIGNVPFDFFRNISIDFRGDIFVEDLDRLGVSKYNAIDVPECVLRDDMLTVFFQYVCISLMEGNFVAGYERLQLAYGFLTPPPCRWLSRHVLEDKDPYKAHFLQKYSRPSQWLLLHAILHGGVSNHDHPSFRKLFENCKVKCSVRQAVEVVIIARKIAYVHEKARYLLNPMHKVRRYLDDYNYDYKQFLKHPLIRPYYKFLRTALNITYQHCENIGYSKKRPKLTIADIIEGASNLWDIKSVYICPHNCRVRDSPCSMSTNDVTYSWPVCVNHCRSFCGDRCVLPECDECPSRGEELMSFLNSCNQRETAVPTSDDKWSWWNYYKYGPSSDWSYPEEGYKPSSNHLWIKDLFEAFTHHFHEFIKTEFATFSDQIKGIFESLWNSIKAPFMSMASCLEEAASPFVKILESMIKILGLSKSLNQRNLTVDLYSVLMSVFIYKFTENPIFKILVAVFILKHFNIVKNVKEFVLFFRNNMFGVPIEGVEESATPTSFFDFITILSSNHNIELIVKLLMTAIFTITGLAATAMHKATLCKSLVELAKNLHFVGAGMQGLVKIWTYLSTGIPMLLQKIRELLNVQNSADKEKKEQEDLKEAFGKKLVLFMTFCKTFDNENGYHLIRRSIKIQKLVLEWFEFMLLAQKCKVDLNYRNIFLPAVSQEFNFSCKAFIKLYDLVIRVTRFGKFRDTPFHIQFMGTIGIGKSTLLCSVANEVKKRYFPDVPNNTLIYTRGKTEYFDGYCNQPIMVQDDIWSVNDYKEVAEILPLISNAPMVIPMAHLTDKATFFDSKFLLTTTNIAFPETTSVWCNKAIWRRRHIFSRVKIDERVYDKTSGKFDIALYRKFYKDEDLSKLPHLSFDILQPIPSQGNGLQVQHEPLPYTEDSTLPQGLTLPLENLTYSVFLEKCFDRYDALRREESMARTMDPDTFADGFNEMLKVLHEVNDIDPNYLGPIGKRLCEVPTVEDDVLGLDREVESELVQEFSNVPEPVEDEIEVDPFSTEQTSEDFSLDDELRVRATFTITYPPYVNSPNLPATMMKENDVKHFTLSNYEYVLADDNLSSRRVRSISTMHAQYLAILHEGFRLLKFKSKLKDKSQLNSEFINIPNFYESNFAALIGELCRYDYVRTRDVFKAENFLSYNPTGKNYYIGKNMMEENRNDGLHQYVRLSDSYVTNTVYKNLGSLITPPKWPKSISDSYLFHPAVISIDQIKKNKVYSEILRDNPNIENDLETYKNLIGQLKHDFVARIVKYNFKQYYIIGQFPWDDERSIVPNEKEDFVCEANELTMRACNIPIPDNFRRFGIKARINYVKEFVIKHEDNTEWSLKMDDDLIRKSDSIVKDIDSVIDRFTDAATKAEIRNDPYHRICARDGRHFEKTGLLYSKVFGDQQDIFISLPDSIKNLIHRVFYNKNIPIISKVRSNFKDNCMYYMAKFNHLVHGKVETLLAGIADLLVSLLVAFYAFLIFYTLKNMFMSFFGTTEVQEPTSRVMFKRSINPNLQSRMRPAIPTSNNDIVENLVNKIRRNQVLLHVGPASSNGLGLDGQNVLCNTHFLRQYIERGEVFELYFSPTSNSTDKWSCFIDPKTQINVIPNSDACIIYSSDFRMFSKIVHLFVTQEDLSKFEMPDEIFNIYNLRGKELLSTFQCYGILDSYKVNFLNNDIRNVLAYRAPKVIGSSGGVIFGCNNYTQRHLYGIQSCATSDVSYAALLTQEILQKNMFRTVIHEGPHDFIEEPTPTSELISSHISCVGRIPKDQVQGIVQKTNFEKTIFARDFEVNSIPAILNAFDSRVPENDHPLKHSINKFGRDVIKPMPPEILCKAEQDISSYLHGCITPSNLRVLSLEESIIGLDRPGYGRVDLSTSPGIPWIWHKQKRGKKDWIELEVDDGSIQYLSPDLRHNFVDVDLQLREGIIPKNSMFEFPKDELRPIDKVLGPPIKTRSISVMNFVYTLLFRKYNLALEAEFHRLATGDFPLCVGINPTSMAWSNLYSSLSKNNECGNDFDIGNWDGHFPPWLFDSVCKVFNLIYNDNDRNQLARKALFLNACFGYTNFLDLVLQKNRGMPSGFAGTATVNTVGHFILFYCFYILICKSNNVIAKFDDFKNLISVYFYGDDVIFSIHQSLQDKGITANSFIQQYVKFGWPISSASKVDDPSISKPLFALQFLKRRFVFDPLYGSSIVYGAIETEVINCLLHWMRKTHNLQQQLFVNIYEALEFAYPNGEDFYNDLLYRINKVLMVKKKMPVVMSYSEVRQVVLDRYFSV